MENNTSNTSPQTANLLTWLFYALISLMILAICYRAYKLRQTAKSQMDKGAAIENSINDVGYVPADTANSSAYLGADTTATYADGSTEAGKTVVDPATGIESSSTAVSPATHSTPAPSGTAKVESPVMYKNDEEGVKVEVTDLDAETEASGTPQYMVISGSFRKLMGARIAKGQLVKKGYGEAEVGIFNRGAFACAIALRTDNLREAQSVAARLRKSGFPDSFVKERQSRRK